MRQVELDPVQGRLHCRAEQQIRPLDADGCCWVQPSTQGKAFVKCKGKGQNKTPGRGKDDRKDIEKVIDKG